MRVCLTDASAGIQTHVSRVKSTRDLLMDAQLTELPSRGKPNELVLRLVQASGSGKML